MNEEELSERLFRAASLDQLVEVLSWQAVNGKTYFTADLRLRGKDGHQIEPDLVLLVAGIVWLIEVKRLHSESLADERKLAAALETTEEQAWLLQISARLGRRLDAKHIRAAVAFARDDLSSAEACARLPHVCWATAAGEIEERGLAAFLLEL